MTFERLHEGEGDFILCPLKCQLVMLFGKPKVRAFKCRAGKLAKESGCMCCPDFGACLDANHDDQSGNPGATKSSALDLLKLPYHTPQGPVPLTLRRDAPEIQDLPRPEAIA